MTPYVDRQLPDGDRQDVEEHLRVCPPCRLRVVAESAVRDLLQARKGALGSLSAPPPSLRAKCAEAARTLSVSRGAAPTDLWRRLTRRAAPVALAASLVLLVGGAFLYRLTETSSRVMAAELAADHMKCFAVAGVLRKRDTAAAVESSMLNSFGWRVHPPDASSAGLELVGARTCLYGEGRAAHIMYRHYGEPVSLFMLPETARPQGVIRVLGHEAAIWCVGHRTYVLVARDNREEVDRLASIVRASLTE